MPKLFFSESGRKEISAERAEEEKRAEREEGRTGLVAAAGAAASAAAGGVSFPCSGRGGKIGGLARKIKPAAATGRGNNRTERRKEE